MLSEKLFISLLYNSCKVKIPPIIDAPKALGGIMKCDGPEEWVEGAECCKECHKANPSPHSLCLSAARIPLNDV